MGECPINYASPRTRRASKRRWVLVVIAIYIAAYPAMRLTESYMYFSQGTWEVEGICRYTHLPIALVEEALWDRYATPPSGG